MTLKASVATLDRIKALVLALLRKIEWDGSETHFLCPACRTNKQSGHQKTCPLAALIDLLDRPEEKSTQT